MIRQFLIGTYPIKLTTVSYGFTRVPRHEKSIGNGATAEKRLHHHITMALCDTIIVFETSHFYQSCYILYHLLYIITNFFLKSMLFSDFWIQNCLENGTMKNKNALSDKNVSEQIKVIHTKYSKHRPSTVAHTFECVCSKINHVLNHGSFILLLKLINCPIH